MTASSCRTLVEPLESRQLLAVSTVVAGAKIKGINLSSNNLSTNQTLVTIPFSGDVNLLDASKIRMFGYAENPLSSKLGQIKKTINISNASILALDVNGDGKVDHQLLQFTTDRLARKGATIILNSGALEDSSHNPLAAQTLHTVKGQNKERFTLACRAFVATNVNYFTPDLYTGAATPSTASTPVDASVVGPKLQAFLNAKATAGVITQAQATAAFARFSDASVIATVPDANLRAAVLALTGTVAAPAIGAILDGQNATGKPWTSLNFGTPPDPSIVTAETFLTNTGRIATVVKPNLSGEDFRALSAVIAHEAMHQDDSKLPTSLEDGLPEEYVGNIAETTTYGQQLLTDSSFVGNDTTLVTFENDKLYALLNSGQGLFPFPGTLAAPLKGTTTGIFAGGATISGGPYTSWDNYIRRLYAARGVQDKNTPGNQTLQAYYNNITQTTGTKVSTFNDTLLPTFDAVQRTIDPKSAVALAHALRLGLA